MHHRLSIAGALPDVAFTPGALKIVQAYSRGIPRLINIACDRSLLTAFVQDRRTVTAAVARRAMRELPPQAGTHPPTAAASKWLLCLAFVLLLFIGALYLHTTVRAPAQGQGQAADASLPAPGKTVADSPLRLPREHIDPEGVPAVPDGVSGAPYIGDGTGAKK